MGIKYLWDTKKVAVATLLRFRIRLKRDLGHFFHFNARKAEFFNNLTQNQVHAIAPKGVEFQ